MALRVPMRVFSTSALLFGLTACGSDSTTPDDGTGQIQFAATTTGENIDPDGYAAKLDADRSQSIGSNATVNFPQVSPGGHSVQLGDVASNCIVTGQNPRTVNVASGATAEVTFQITCTGSGSIQLITTTAGLDIDPDGYTATVDVDRSAPVGANGTVVFVASAGSHSVGIEGVAANCTLTGLNPRDVVVAASATASVTFSITCVSTSGAIGELAFNSDRDGNFEIYRVRVDGTGLHRLTVNAGQDAHASWSPDGSRIAFHTDRDGNVEIYAMDADGSNVVRLTTFAGLDQLPDWSPDGSKIAFVRNIGAPNFTEIFVMNADGTNPVNLTNVPDFALTPAWSPDGSRIAYTTDRDYDINSTELAMEIYLLNVNGTPPQNITNHDTAEDGAPAWSPDGARIAFHTNRNGNYEIYVMNADGSSPVNLTNHSAQDFNPSWSKDGSKIAFETNRDGNSEIYIMNANGTGPLRITNNPAADAFPAWKP